MVTEGVSEVVSEWKDEWMDECVSRRGIGMEKWVGGWIA